MCNNFLLKKLVKLFGIHFGEHDVYFGESDDNFIVIR
ncbi:hypothetical protein BVRB_7g164960 [Beta vulgaris subsp. vulgaris]|uniref:Uncharacterized protein n=1 Tax=Beta vulgaris subsp. vulgaris TaxID=3555 RepID=A0A0J8BWH5_BETVV|nr:hypothetical protein BVRB_7g164960 [Beta vulgaris subsp. vulgaris]